MGLNKDGAAKNLQVVVGEWKAFGTDQLHNGKRFIAALYQVGHIGVAFISTTFQTLPRTMTYSLLVYCLYRLVV